MLIYLLRNRINGKGYVGQTIQTFEERWSAHLCQDLYVDRAIRAHGAENFEHIILQVCSTIDELNAAETFHIGQQNTLAPNGYNLTTSGMNRIPSAETRAKISRALIGKKRPPRSQKHRKNLSSALKGKKPPLFTKEHRRKLSKARIGKSHPQTEETRKKISEALTGRKHFHKGHSLSEETKHKIGLALLGNKNGCRNKKTEDVIDEFYPVEGVVAISSSPNCTAE